MKKFLPVHFPIVISISTTILTSIFLSGKIIYIPNGTHRGGVISAIGVFVIVIIMFSISFVIYRVNRSK